MKKDIYRFGYEQNAEGQWVINDQESKIIKLIFNNYLEYRKHPPKELVDEIIEEVENNHETITYQEAEQKVSFERIDRYIADEINQMKFKS